MSETRRPYRTIGTQVKGSTSEYLVQDGCVDVNRVRWTWTWTVISCESLQLFRVYTSYFHQNTSKMFRGDNLRGSNSLSVTRLGSM